MDDELSALIQRLTADVARHRNLGEDRKALDRACELADLTRERLGERHVVFGASLKLLASLYESLGEYVASEPLRRLAGEIDRLAYGEVHIEYAVDLNYLATVCYHLGRYPEARDLYEQCSYLLETYHDADGDLAGVLNNLALVNMTVGRYQEATALYRRAMDIYTRLHGPSHQDVATCLHNLAGLHREQGEYDAAESYYQRSLAIRTARLGADDLEVSVSLLHLGGLCETMGRYDRALYICNAAWRFVNPDLNPATLAWPTA